MSVRVRSSILVLMLIVSIGVAYWTLVLKPQAKERTNTLDRMERLKIAIKTYRSHLDLSPSSLDDLIQSGTVASCSVDTDSSSPTYRKLRGWCGPYVDRPFLNQPDQFKTDAWGTLFDYSSATLLRSCGKNRKCGDGDDVTMQL